MTQDSLLKDMQSVYDRVKVTQFIPHEQYNSILVDMRSIYKRVEELQGQNYELNTCLEHFKKHYKTEELTKKIKELQEQRDEWLNVSKLICSDLAWCDATRRVDLPEEHILLLLDLIAKFSHAKSEASKSKF